MAQKPDNDEQEQTTETLAVQRALGGKVRGLDLLRAHVDRTGGQTRPQQEAMVSAVQDAISTKNPLLAQAGTGTGKSLAYLFPVAAKDGIRAVIATATNQLSEQLIRHDLPQVAETVEEAGGELSFALLKGRHQYACLAKINEIENLNQEGEEHAAESDRLFDLDEDLASDDGLTKRTRAKGDAKAAADVIAWARKSGTGDRSEAPSVADRVWAQVSTTSTDCPGAQSCPFGDVCFAEVARRRARESKIVVTNHALLATEIKKSLEVMNEGNQANPSHGMFGKHDVVIVDEAHDLASALTSALSTEIDPRSVSKLIAKAAQYSTLGTSDTVEEASIAALRALVEDFEENLEGLPSGPLVELPKDTIDLLTAITSRLILLENSLSSAAGRATSQEKPKRAASIAKVLEQVSVTTAKFNAARALEPGMVRWVDQRRPEDSPVLKTAPIQVGEPLQKALSDRVLIGTSATLTVGEDFTPIQRVLGLDRPATETLDVGTPFDYPKQGMLYIPKHPFPEPVGKDRTAHTEAVLEDVLALVTAAGGRTLGLFTTTAGARRAADYLREHLPHLNVHATGDAPADVLVRQFAEEETSVLCATMGLWQGVSVEGPSCTLVIIDKVAFAPMDDVLTAARRAHVDAQRRDGFTEVMVAQAATSLAQGAGRLIRSTSDKGVVAILDPRIHTKGYGRLLLKTLPNFGVFTDRAKVLAALERLTGGTTAATRAISPAKPDAIFSSGGSRGSGPRRASSTRKLASGTKPIRPKRVD